MVYIKEFTKCNSKVRRFQKKKTRSYGVVDKQAHYKYLKLMLNFRIFLIIPLNKCQII